MAKMRHCFYCGEAIGEYVDYDPLDTCGKQECERAARDLREEQRQAAHDKLDQDMGWS
jgi:hypothetical protein